MTILKVPDKIISKIGGRETRKMNLCMWKMKIFCHKLFSPQQSEKSMNTAIEKGLLETMPIEVACRTASGLNSVLGIYIRPPST